jgi:hypothetical protein
MPAFKRPAAGDADASDRLAPLPPTGPAPAAAAVNGELAAASLAAVSGGAVLRSPPGAPPAAAPVEPMAPASPGRNRQLFLASVTPQHMTCDLRSAVVGLGIKHNLVAIVVAVFPTQQGPPARKHILIMDSFGVTGVTVWNGDVHKFSKNVLGGVINITRASVASYQGKKNLVLSKESVVTVSTAGQCAMADWWNSLTAQPPLQLPAALIAADNSVINIFGVVAFVSSETKEVNGQPRIVTSVHLASQTARFQLRGWDLDADVVQRWESLRDQVVQVLRIRVTCFADNKIGEILDSPTGTSVKTFHDPALERFWAE